MGHVLWLNPVFKEMIWGGEKLKSIYNYDIPSNQTGECWAISAHHNGDCIINQGEYEGMTLSSLYQEHRVLFGNIKDSVFPLLVKIIDANADLSVQVHPDDSYASTHENSLGKTECWYVLDVDKNAQMVLGHNAKTKEEFIKAINEDDYESLLRRFPIKQGDVFYIPAGTIHAICKGTLIYEAQQSSDITYRVYDYHRKDTSGKERELHVSQAIDVTTIPYKEYHLEDKKEEILENGKKTKLIESKMFTLEKYDLYGKNIINNDKPFQLVSVIEGEGTIDSTPVKKGSHCIICFDQKQTLFDGNMQVMICTL